MRGFELALVVAILLGTTIAYSPYTENLLRTHKSRHEEVFGVGHHQLRKAQVDRKLMSPKEHSEKYLKQGNSGSNGRPEDDDIEIDEDAKRDPKSGCKDLKFRDKEYKC